MGQCYELKEAFNLLLERPIALTLVTNESYPTNRRCSDKLVLADYDKPNTTDPTKREYFEVEGLSHFMHIVNRMSNAVRTHFKNEYDAKLIEYRQRAQIALAEKRRMDRKKEVVAIEIGDDKMDNTKPKKSDKEEMDASEEEEEDVDIDGGDKEKEKEVGLDSKEQFDLAAQMALMRSNQIMDDEQEEDGGDESSDNGDVVIDNNDDENIEYESSSASSSED